MQRGRPIWAASFELICAPALSRRFGYSLGLLFLILRALLGGLFANLFGGLFVGR